MLKDDFIFNFKRLSVEEAFPLDTLGSFSFTYFNGQPKAEIRLKEKAEKSRAQKIHLLKTKMRAIIQGKRPESRSTKKRKDHSHQHHLEETNQLRK
jgi:hypothetical protein